MFSIDEAKDSDSEEELDETEEELVLKHIIKGIVREQTQKVAKATLLISRFLYRVAVKRQFDKLIAQTVKI